MILLRTSSAISFRSYVAWVLSFVVVASPVSEFFCFFAGNVLEEDRFFPVKAYFDFMKPVILILCPGGNTNSLRFVVVAIEVSLLACRVGGKQECLEYIM